jgi:E3 ubiquitin-protein ligase HUWE1
MGRSLREIEGRIHVSFKNEQGHDAGGLRREWFLLLSREIFNQDYALFEKSSSGSTYQPNPKSYINNDHLNYFKFIGRFVGKALV